MVETVEREQCLAVSLVSCGLGAVDLQNFLQILLPSEARATPDLQADDRSVPSLIQGFLN